MLIFDRIEKDYLTVDFEEARPSSGERSFELFQVPGMAGALVGEVSTGVKEFEIPISVYYKDFEELQKIKEDMNGWLITDDARELQFKDELDRVYYARFVGTVRFEREDIRVAKGTLRFICADPHRYGPEEIANVIAGYAEFYYPGQVNGLPEIELDVLDDVTHIDVVSEGQSFRIGRLETVERPPFVRTELIATYPLTNLTGWSVAPSVEDGYVTGQMAADSNGMYAELYGASASPYKFQGPAVRRSLPFPLQNFRIDVDVNFPNGVARTNKVEIFCFDASGNQVAKFGLEDIWPTLARIQATFTVGDIMNRAVNHIKQASSPSAWNNFKGTIRLNRDGNRFRPYFSLVDANGRHVWTHSAFVYTDVEGAHLAEITQVMIAIRSFPNTERGNIRLKNMRVFRYNTEPEGVPVIATFGDKVVIDTRTQVVRINGEVRKDLKAFALKYPYLKTGLNQITFEPAERLKGIMRYRGRYH